MDATRQQEKAIFPVRRPIDTVCPACLRVVANVKHFTGMPVPNPYDSFNG